MAINEAQVFGTWIEVDGRFEMSTVIDYPESDWTDKSEMTDAEIVDGAPMVCTAYIEDVELTTLRSDTSYLVAWSKLKNRIENINLDKLMSLSDVQKLAAFLRDVTGLTNQEIADSFNTTPAALSAFLQTKTRAEVVILLKRKWRRLT